MKQRICVVTAGHLSTCPRMLKAADALAGAGYQVRVVSTRHVPWATVTDGDLRKSRSWDWNVVDYDSKSAPLTYLRSGVRYRVANKLAKSYKPSRLPLQLTARAYSRVHTELLREALSEFADLFYGGTTGALAAIAMAGLKAKVPYALDLEDFHSEEQDRGAGGHLAHALAERIENDVLRGAAFLTAGSEAIASAYKEKYGIQPITINNTFPLPDRSPDFKIKRSEGLKLYWFSQTIGPGRGLEDAIKAMGIANIPGELHLQGQPIQEYLNGLKLFIAKVAPQVKVFHHKPVSPDSMIRLMRGYDIGLALEPGFSKNNLIALSNKAFTYLLGGLAVIFTDTPGQRPLALDIKEGAFVYAPGDVQELAAGMKRWADNKDLLMQAKKAAWEAAKRRWHWEHPEERGRLLCAVARALS